VYADRTKKGVAMGRFRQSPSRFVRTRPFRRTLTIAIGLATVAAIWVTAAYANHPVLVEGNCNGTEAQTGLRTTVPPGTCGDYDGDGRIGTAEDTDEADRVFGTIGAALGPGTGAAAGTGANQNGSVTIVSSGVFAETVNITAAGGNVTLQGAPGVEANIDAVLQGAPGNAQRQGAPGIIVNSPSNRYVVIRNITSRNWTSGIQVLGDSRVAIMNSRMENNVNYGIEIKDNARVTVARSEVFATGFRTNPATGNFPSAANIPNPGKGIEFDDQSSGTIHATTVSGSFGAGISNQTRRRICATLVNLFDNSPNIEGTFTFLGFASSCVEDRRNGQADAKLKAKSGKAKPTTKRRK
jgi:hypothetical protein